MGGGKGVPWRLEAAAPLEIGSPDGVACGSTDDVVEQELGALRGMVYCSCLAPNLYGKLRL